MTLTELHQIRPGAKLVCRDGRVGTYQGKVIYPDETGYFIIQFAGKGVPTDIDLNYLKYFRRADHV